MKQNLSLFSLLILVGMTPADWIMAQDKTLGITPAVNEFNSSPVHDQLPALGDQSIGSLSGLLAPPGKKASGIGSFSLFSNEASRRSLMKTGASLVLVISLFLLVVFLLRMRKPAAKRGLPGDVVAVLGQTQLGQAQRLQLIRLASKILLISTTQNGSQTLGEITDPEEVYRIESICRDGKWPSFSQTLKERAERHALHQRVDQSVLGSHQPRAEQRGRTLLEA